MAQPSSKWPSFVNFVWSAWAIVSNEETASDSSERMLTKKEATNSQSLVHCSSGTVAAFRLSHRQPLLMVSPRPKRAAKIQT